MRNLKIYIKSSLLLLTLLLFGCGQIGPLHLPVEQSDNKSQKEIKQK